MRKLPYVALALAGLLLANVVASWALPGYRETLRSLRGDAWTGSVLPPVEVAPAQGDVPDEAAGTGMTVLGSEVVSGLETVRVTHDPGLTPVAAEPDPETSSIAETSDASMPESLILRLIPKIVLEKTDKSRIFGRDFPGLSYATYADTRYELGAHAISADMDSVRALFSDEESRLADTDAFFGRTVFYNLDDGRVRFFFPFAGKTVAMDLPSKYYYEILKPLLLP